MTKIKSSVVLGVALAAIAVAAPRVFDSWEVPGVEAQTTCASDEIKITYRDRDNDEVVTCEDGGLHSGSAVSITVRSLKSSTVSIELGSDLVDNCNYSRRWRVYQNIQHWWTGQWTRGWEDESSEGACPGGRRHSFTLRGPEAHDWTDSTPEHNTHSRNSTVFIRYDGPVYDCSGWI